MYLRAVPAAWLATISWISPNDIITTETVVLFFVVLLLLAAILWIVWLVFFRH